MSYKSQGINTSASTFATAPEHRKVAPTGIKIYNGDGASRVITGTDVFTPDSSHGVSSPSEQTKQVVKVSLGAGLTADIPDTELKDAKCLGTLKFACDAISSDSPVVSLFYHTE